MPRHRRNKGGDDDVVVGGGKARGAGKRGKQREMSMDRGSVASEMTGLSLDGEDADSGGTVAAVADLDADIVADDSDAVIDRKLVEALDNYCHKNSAVRLAALKISTGVLSRYFVPDIAAERLFTLCETAERALRRGPGEEGVLGARLSALLAIQLCSGAAESLRPHRQQLLSAAVDGAKPGAYRAICAEALALVNFLSEAELDEVQAALAALRGVWTAFRPGAHGEDGSGGPALFAASLGGWAQLLRLLTPRARLAALLADLPRLCSYLDAHQIDIRIEAGETLALLYEIARNVDLNFRPPNHQQTLETLDMLSTDPERHRSKRDRRLQKSTFRQIFSSVEQEEVVEWKVKLGSETLVIDNWEDKVLYDSLCGVLRGGMAFQLRWNATLRDVFDLGPPLEVNGHNKSENKLSKAELQAHHAASCRRRQTARKNRRDQKALALAPS